MTTIVVQTTKRIASPRYGRLTNVTTEDPDVNLPPLPEPAPSITPRIMLDARKLNLAQGAVVNNWVATGSGTVEERTFNNIKGGSSWTYPKFDTTSIKSLSFDRTSLLANNNATVINPVNSYVVVAKATNAPIPSNQAARGRFFTGTVADGFQGFYPLADRLAMGAGLKNEVDVAPFPAGEWFIAVLIFDGANSKLMLSNNASIIPAPTVGVSAQTLISIGGNYNFSTHGDGGLLGNIALFAQYNKALTDTEIKALMTYYRQEFKL